MLEHIYDRSGKLRERFPAVLTGPGDDCAVVATPRGDALLLTVDQLVEGRHFILHERFAASGRAEHGAGAGASLDQVAHKAVARSVSDIAAMGGAPSWALAAGLIPPGWAHADALFDAMAHAAAQLNCPLVGGDVAMWGSESGRTHEDAIVLTVTVGGLPHEARGPVLRSGAKPGDLVYVTGSLGGSLASGRHLGFTPRTAEATWLCDALGDDLHAMIDVSDGLGLDASRIGVASGVVLEADAAALPRHPDVPDWRPAAADGEDYELLFTAAASARVPERCPATGVAITQIGQIVPASSERSPGCRIRTPDGAESDGATLGWDHGGSV